MTRKIRPPTTPEGQLEIYFRQEVGRIAGRARRVLFTANDIVSDGGVNSQVFLKTLSSDFFRSIGDSLFFTFFGRVVLPALSSGDFTINLLDESDALITKVAELSLSASASFYGDANVNFKADKEIRAASRISTDDPAVGTLVVIESVVTLMSKKLKFEVVTNGGVNEVNIDYFQVEFSPGFV